jgi:pilus assembly protein CpaE
MTAPKAGPGPERRVKLLLALGDERIRSSFTQALEGYPGGAPQHVCADSDEALRLAQDIRPDVALLTTTLAPLDGFQAAQEIVTRVPGVSVLLVAQDPAPEDFRKALKAGVRDMLQIPVEKRELFAAIDAAVEVSKGKRTALEGLAQEALAEERIQPAVGITVFSTKGGTGKTFVATNLGAGLAAAGKRVALVDLDLQFGDVAIALGMAPERTLFDLVQTYTEFDLTLMNDFMLKHPSGLHILPAPLYPDQADQISVEDINTILRVIQDGYDFVIVDTPPFFEERVLVALDWADHVLLIGSLDLPSIKNIKLSFTTMDLMAYPDTKLRIVLNRADSKVGLDVAEVQRHLGRPVRQSISSSIDVPRALNAGEVLLLTKPECRVSRELSELVGSFGVTSMNGKRKFGVFGKH